MDTAYSSPGFEGSPGRDERGWMAERRERDWRAEQEGENSAEASEQGGLSETPQVYVCILYIHAYLS